jgi:hypothetical protein
VDLASLGGPGLSVKIRSRLKDETFWQYFWLLVKGNPSNFHSYFTRGICQV